VRDTHKLLVLTAALSIQRAPDRAVVEYPGWVHPLPHASRCLDGLPAQVQACGANWKLVAPGDPTVTDRTLRHFFARLNGLPTFTHVDLGSYAPAPRPLVSCIILLTANDRFAVLQQLPALVESSRGHPIEILLVLNGREVDREALRGFELVDSDFALVACGYNAGARRARGDYLAFFHDDCLLWDPHWIDKSLALLDAGHAVATAELDTSLHGPPVARCTPWVMRASEFVACGGFDEHFCASYEQEDLSNTVLARNGTLARLTLGGYLHYGAMSSAIVLGTRPEHYKEVFAYGMLPPEQVRFVGNVTTTRVHRDHPGMERQRVLQRAYLLAKHSALLGRYYPPKPGSRVAFPPDFDWEAFRSNYQTLVGQITRLKE
jgi:hypothetical protein